MRIEITKDLKDDAIRIIRDDGSVAETRFPKKGPVPHDGVHAIVERGFGLKHAFWGLVAGGRHPEEIAAFSASLGHASAKRADVPGAAIVELVQSERLVECFEAEIWGGETELALLQDVADAAMAQSKAPRIALDANVIADVRRKLAAMTADWRAMKAGETMAFDWPEQ